ncbi:S26 family signal peptidase [Saccharolobus shibatae]|uniref:Signal peptidase I n=1 Tax=Saccharolobus shibatae TaxID=2286 RepID=A0A8F5BZ36_9CREN|nr:S26 family signal peptidase [Saccharolobus shibatae]QXJ34031.1 hypothetical protein J5U22_00576 [Saccharolobus shibatae]
MIKIVVVFLVSLFLASIIFSIISQTIFHLPYGWNIEITNSMYPLLKPGDLVFVFPIVGKPSLNEIIAYKSPFLNYYVVHQIINFTNNGYITKGINNPTPDPWIVKSSWIKGFVPELFGQPVIIPYIGNLIALVRGTTGYIVAFIVIFVIYGISEIFDRNQAFVMTTRRRNKLKIIDPKTLAIAFLVLSFATFMILFSPHVIFAKLMWNSVPNAPFTPRQLSNNLGAVPPYSTIPVTLSVNYHPFLLEIPLIVLHSPNLKLQDASLNQTFLLYSSSPGLHSEIVNIEILPEILPPQILNFLFIINPMLPLIGESIEASAIVSAVVYIIVKKLR